VKGFEFIDEFSLVGISFSEVVNHILLISVVHDCLHFSFLVDDISDDRILFGIDYVEYLVKRSSQFPQVVIHVKFENVTVRSVVVSALDSFTDFGRVIYFTDDKF